MSANMDLVIENHNLKAQIDKLRKVLDSMKYPTWQCQNCHTVVHVENKPTRWCCKRHKRQGRFCFCHDCIHFCEYLTSPATSDDDSD